MGDPVADDVVDAAVQSDTERSGRPTARLIEAVGGHSDYLLGVLSTLTWPEVEAILERVEAHKARYSGLASSDNLLALIEALASSFRKHPPSEDGKSASAGLRFVEASESATGFLSRTIPKPVSLLGDGILSESEFAVMYGMPGLGKSWNALYLGIAIANEAPWYGIETQRARVGILSMELPEYHLQSRLRTLVTSIPGADQLSADAISLICRPSLKGPVNLGTDEHIEELEAWIRHSGLQFVIIDPLSRVHLVDESASVEIAPVLNRLEAVRHSTRCAMIVIHHERKPSAQRGGDDDLASLRGSGRLLSDPTSLIRITKAPRDLVRVVFTKLNFGPAVDPIYLRQSESGPYEVAESPEKVGDENRRKVAEAIKAAGPTGLTPPEIGERTGLSRQTANKHAKALVEAGEAVPKGSEKCPRYVCAADTASQGTGNSSILYSANA